MVDAVSRFSDRVDAYVKYRPTYPREIVPYLAETVGLTPEWLIADVGCGPGISSTIFLENGNRVTGVEPNDAMREAAREYLSEFDQFELVNGRSDSTGLPDRSLDMVMAAQAFHWFDPVSTRSEFDRIRKPGAPIMLMWNLRQETSTPFLFEYEAFIQRWSSDYHVVKHNNIGDDEVEAFLGTGCTKAVFENKQVLDFDGVLGRISSSSYMPPEGSDAFGPMSIALRELFAKHAVADRIEILYDTIVYTSHT